MAHLALCLHRPSYKYPVEAKIDFIWQLLPVWRGGRGPHTDWKCMLLSEKQKKSGMEMKLRSKSFSCEGLLKQEWEQKWCLAVTLSFSQVVALHFLPQLQTWRPVKPAVNVNDGSSQIDVQPSFMLRASSFLIPALSYFPGTAAERLRAGPSWRSSQGIVSSLSLSHSQNIEAALHKSTFVSSWEECFLEKSAGFGFLSLCSGLGWRQIKPHARM